MKNDNSIVILDDFVFSTHLITGWNIGPNKVWNDGLKDNVIIELGREEYPEFSKGRGMAWGKYI